MPNQFTKEYFIKKFEAIPEHRWTTGMLKIIVNEPCKPLDYKCCAAGHCGVRERAGENLITPEAKALSLLIDPKQTRVYLYPIVKLNDDTNNRQGFGTTPKQRILNKLKSL